MFRPSSPYHGEDCAKCGWRESKTHRPVNTLTSFKCDALTGVGLLNTHCAHPDTKQTDPPPSPRLGKTTDICAGGLLIG